MTHTHTISTMSCLLLHYLCVSDYIRQKETTQSQDKRRKKLLLQTLTLQLIFKQWKHETSTWRGRKGTDLDYQMLCSRLSFQAAELLWIFLLWLYCCCCKAKQSKWACRRQVHLHTQNKIKKCKDKEAWEQCKWQAAAAVPMEERELSKARTPFQKKREARGKEVGIDWIRKWAIWVRECASVCVESLSRVSPKVDAVSERKKKKKGRIKRQFVTSTGRQARTRYYALLARIRVTEKRGGRGRQVENRKRRF